MLINVLLNYIKKKTKEKTYFLLNPASKKLMHGGITNLQNKEQNVSKRFVKYKTNTKDLPPRPSKARDSVNL